MNFSFGHVTCYTVEGNGQALWGVTDFAQSLYNTTDARKATARVKQAETDIHEIHSQLWPGMAIDEGEEIISEDSRIKVVPTSLVFSTLVWCFSETKRPPPLRQRAASVLSFLLKEVWSRGKMVPIIHFGLGEMQGVLKHICPDTESGCINAWSNEYLNVIKPLWDADVLDGNKPWLFSPISHVTLVQYILFGLDPVPFKCPKFDTLDSTAIKFIKLQLRGSALTLVSACAYHFDALCHSLDSGRADRKRRRTPDGILREWVANIAERMYSQEDRFISQARTKVLGKLSDDNDLCKVHSISFKLSVSGMNIRN